MGLKPEIKIESTTFAVITLAARDGVKEDFNLVSACIKTLIADIFAGILGLTVALILIKAVGWHFKYVLIWRKRISSNMHPSKAVHNAAYCCSNVATASRKKINEEDLRLAKLGSLADDKGCW
ncbi:hypothetical protein RQN30_06230 [Arcanobacterium hippocoleae]